MKELFIKYLITRDINDDIEWDIIPVEEGMSVKDTVKDFETKKLLSSDEIVNVDIMTVNLV